MKCPTPLMFVLSSLSFCLWMSPALAQDERTPSEDAVEAQTTPSPDDSTPTAASPQEEDPQDDTLKVSPAYDAIQAKKDKEKVIFELKARAMLLGMEVTKHTSDVGDQQLDVQLTRVETLLTTSKILPTKDSPQLNPAQPIYCITLELDDAKRRHFRMQFDNDARSYMVAEDTLYKEDLQTRALVSTNRRAQQLGRGCSSDSRYTAQYVHDALVQGYTLVPATLDTQYGYARDERNRTFQTHFDLRARFGIGVYYVGTLAPGSYESSVGLEVFGTYEDWNPYSRTRRRTRFLEGGVSLAPFFARATVFETEESEQSEDPLLFIATMVGTPKRYDINLDIHTALTLGRLDYRTLNGRQYSQLDIAEGRLQWELLRSLDMEDYILLHVGAGTGTRRWTDADSEALYLYPQVGARGAWTLSPRGLLELQAEANVRWGKEFEGDQASWTSATSSVGIEWLALSLSNQPLTLFARHEWEYLDLRNTKRDIKTHSMRWSAGLRVSLFVPPPVRALPTEEQP